MSVQDLFQGAPALVPGALRGYRTWAGLTIDGRLMSTGMRHDWQPACFRGAKSTGYERARHVGTPNMWRHEAPDVACVCGIYGWYDPADTRILDRPVFGVIEATGRTILGTHGFRAQTVTVLGITSDDPDTRHQLKQLGYPVHPTREALIRAFPPEDMSGLVDHDCHPRCTAGLAPARVVATSAAREALELVLARTVIAVADLIERTQAALAARGQDARTVLAALDDADPDAA